MKLRSRRTPGPAGQEQLNSPNSIPSANLEQGQHGSYNEPMHASIRWAIITGVAAVVAMFAAQVIGTSTAEAPFVMAVALAAYAANTVLSSVAAFKSKMAAATLLALTAAFITTIIGLGSLHVIFPEWLIDVYLTAAFAHLCLVGTLTVHAMTNQSLRRQGLLWMDPSLEPASDKKPPQLPWGQ